MSTLAELIDLAELDLRDTGNANWSIEELTAHIQRALRSYNQVDPIRAVAEVELVAASREVSLATLPGLMQLTDVWYPYDADTYPPKRPRWELLSEDTLYLLVEDAPRAGQWARLFYTRGHTIDGLDGADATTLDGSAEGLVVLGATAYAALQYAQATINTVTVSGWTPRQLQEWAAGRLAAFREGLEAVRRRAVLEADARVSWQAATRQEGQGGVV